MVAVDGGHEYLRRLGSPSDYEEASVKEEDFGSDSAIDKLASFLAHSS
jgi:hypothetical protein